MWQWDRARRAARRLLARRLAAPYVATVRGSTEGGLFVVVDLGRAGLSKLRMGSAGYADNQPVMPNTDEKARSQNRRVEIFVLAPEAAIAGWDPLGSDSSTR